MTELEVVNFTLWAEFLAPDEVMVASKAREIKLTELQLSTPLFTVDAASDAVWAGLVRDTTAVPVPLRKNMFAFTLMA